MQLLTQSGSEVSGYSMHFIVKSTLELEGVNTKGQTETQILNEIYETTTNFSI